MAQQTINIGTAPNDGTGDKLRIAGDKINDNFTELYSAVDVAGVWTMLDATGAPITSGAAWTYSTPVANVDLIGLAAYTDLLVIAQGVSASISGVRQLLASTNNGSTFYSTSGNYLSIAADGISVNVASWGNENTNSTAARTVTYHIIGANILNAPKMCTFSGSTAPRLFVADNANNVDALRINNSGGGNLTAGTIYLFGR